MSTTPPVIPPEPYIDPMLANEVEVTVSVRHPRFMGIGKMGTSFRMDAATATDEAFKMGMASATEALLNLFGRYDKQEIRNEQFLQEISEHPF